MAIQSTPAWRNMCSIVGSLWFGAASAVAVSPFTSATASPIIIKTSTLQVSLKGSRFRHLGAFNAALAAALKRCGRAVPVKVTDEPDRVSAVTAGAIRQLRACPGWDIAGEARSGDVTEELWTRLLPNIAAPDAFGRLFIATLTLEGTDYDHFEWNYSSIDPTAWGTWGPFGATIGQDGEIQQILAAAQQQSPDIVRNAFAKAAHDTTPVGEVPSANGRARYCVVKPSSPTDDYDLFRKIANLRGATAGKAMRSAFCDDRRFAIWVRAFRLLGAQPKIRRAYDALYLASGRKAAQYIENVRRAYALAGATATEIDVAMGVDGQTQLSSRADISRVAQAIRSAGSKATPVQRRVAISEALPVRNGSMKDRCGRDQVFIHATAAVLPLQPVCIGTYTSGEKKGQHWNAADAWSDRANFVAEQVGLRDIDGSAIAANWNYDFDQDSSVP